MISLKLNKFKFSELKKKPKESFLLKYYENIYFQQNKAFYKKNYSNSEKKYIESKIYQKYMNIYKIRKNKLNGNLLDIGCGKGEFLKYFKLKGWTVTGIEKSSESLDKKNKFLKKNIITGNATEIIKQLISKDLKYDLVVLNNVLEHLLEPELILKLLKKLLKKNGILSINVPNDESLLQKFLLKKNLIKKNYWVVYPDHINYFNINTFRNFINKLGYKVVDSISDFPIEHFLFNKNSNYILNKKLGKNAHLSRIMFEQFLMENYKIDEINDYYRSMSKIGIGRNINYFCKKIKD